jgi:hypothetical protein
MPKDDELDSSGFVDVEIVDAPGGGEEAAP